jgi:excinuclease ABC subunit A
MDTLTVHNACEHNLKNVTLSIPRDKLVVFTGVSGSGKSSLAFDTIFAEGQRRYVESLSSYARQFIGQFEKPAVEAIDGLSPAISIDQKSTSRSPRSTVGTVTEIVDFLRVLYARVGEPHCPQCAQPIAPQSAERILDTLWAWPLGSKLQILAPMVRGRKGEYNALFTQLRKEGLTRVRIDGELHRLEDLSEDHRLAKTKKHTIDAVIDRIVLKHDDLTRSRLYTALKTALKKADGFAIVQDVGENTERFFSEMLACPTCDVTFEELAPRLFSFNSPYGACGTCQGLGVAYAFSERLLVPDGSKSLLDGAIPPFQKLVGRYFERFLKKLSAQYGVRVNVPFDELSAAEKQLLFLGQRSDELPPVAEDEGEPDWFDWVASFDGLIPMLTRRLSMGTASEQNYLEGFLQENDCPACAGSRLKPVALSVTLGGLNIHQLCSRSIKEALYTVRTLELAPTQQEIARQALLEVANRLQFLLDVGLDYLTLARSAATLSGGEAQRIRLASQIGAGLSGVLYVLDEPSIGLHPVNNTQLIQTLTHLRDQGNSLIVVEHDEEMIRSADWVVDIGPGAGPHGGQVLAEGPPEALEAVMASVTGAFLSGRRQLPVAHTPRDGTGENLTLVGATRHNLKNVTVHFPLGKLIAVTGLSGSGKSTLVFDLLYPALLYAQNPLRVRPTGYNELLGVEHLDKIIPVDQSPIGRTSRSNPATYTGIFDPIRQVFAATELAKIRGYGPGRFSFNMKAGRCEVCKGAGEVTHEMNFLPDVHTRCEVCNGSRYNAETLEVTYQGKTIADVLNMTVNEALGFFERQPRIHRLLQVLVDVGLGYIGLGQPAPTLSGGEAQRIKLATEFCRRDTGQTLYLLDEPTVGLHWHDLDNLLTILNRLVDAGNTVMVIEHNTDFIRACDYVIDMGPEGGERGGQVLAEGPPQVIAQCPESLTGRYLAGQEL